MNDRTLSAIIDGCLDEIATGRATVAECLERYPEHHADLEPLLSAATTMLEAPRHAERAPDPARRAAFMAQIRTLPQESPRRSATAVLRGLFVLPTLPTRLLPRLAYATAPVAAALLLAFVLLAGQPATPASASTLTVFAGGVERQDGNAWRALDDGTQLTEGTRFRTTADGHALLTFADGSTAALAPGTEVLLERLSQEDAPRVVALRQFSGRLWNDVEPDTREGAAYAVHTPDAIVEVRGTVFETAIQDGETSVAAADGAVEVVAGTARVQVLPGEALVARQQQITEHATSGSSGSLTVDGPFAAALLAPSGNATGARTDGAVFRQIPGVTTSNPGVGPQRFDFQQVAPGDYTLVIDRFADGDGDLLLEGMNGERRVALDRETDTVSVQVRVTVEDGAPRLQLLNTQPQDAPAADSRPVRIVETVRTRAAQALAAQRSANVASRGASAREEQPGRPPVDTGRGDSTPAPTSPTRVPTPDPERIVPARDPDGTASPSGTPPPQTAFAYERALREALSGDNPGVLRDRLAEAVIAQDETTRQARLTLLAMLLGEGNNAERARRATADDMELHRELIAAADSLPSDLGIRLRRALGATESNAPAGRAGALPVPAGPPPARTAVSELGGAGAAGTTGAIHARATPPTADASLDRLERALRQAISGNDASDIRETITDILDAPDAETRRERAQILGSLLREERVDRALAGERHARLRAALADALETPEERPGVAATRAADEAPGRGTGRERAETDTQGAPERGRGPLGIPRWPAWLWR